MFPKSRGLRSVMIPRSFFFALERGLERDLDPGTTASLLYDIGREAGRTLVKDQDRDADGGGHGEAAFRDLLEAMGDEYGWAEINLKAVDVAGKFAVIGWRNALETESHDRPLPGCHIGRGLLSAAGTAIFGADCDAIETQCQAMGADHCEIVVGRADRVAQAAEDAEPLFRSDGPA